jgi:hypothetical protein
MNREGAETYLRLLAEAEMRGVMTPASRPSWSGGPAPRPPWSGAAGGGTARLAVVAQALISVDALDAGTAQGIMADFDLAVSVRQHCDQPSPGPAGAAGPGPASATGPRPGRIRFGGTGPMRPVALPARTWRSPAQVRPERPTQGGPERFVPVGRPVPFRDEGISGELFLMSYAHTGSGARFTVAWRIRGSSGPHQMGLAHPPMLCQLFEVTDERGGRYELEFTPGGGPGWTGEVSLRPDPPDDIDWLDIAASGDPAVRVPLDQAAGPSGAGQTEGSQARASEIRASETTASEVKASPGEHLLTMFAERLLTAAPDLPPDLGLQLPGPPGPLYAIAAGLGDVIAALEAADVLSPLSPVPGWLATLCASLRISGHGITVRPAPDLPEPWLSLLAHYQRRKPDTAPVRDGYAAVAVALPELDGIRLALLGLHNSEGGTSIHALARGLVAEGRPVPFGTGTDFPLSVWIRDSGGRWHAARASGWNRADGEYALRLQLVPPLARSTAWIEVLAAGQSAEVRARVPLRWGYPS